MATQTLADLLLLASKHGPTRFGIQESQLAKLISDGIPAGGMSIGGAVTSATSGSLLFAGAGGVLAQDNAQLFWDDTNNRLGLGTAAPTTVLQVINPSTTVTGANIQNTSATSSGRGLYVQHAGLGRGLEVSLSNAANTAAMIRADGTHVGNTLTLSATTGRVISATNTGSNTGIFMNSTSAASPASAIYGQAVGTGTAAYGGVTGQVGGAGIGSGVLAVRNSAGRSLRVGTDLGAAISISPSYAMLVGNSYDLTLPPTQGAATTILQNDGSGNLSWIATPGAQTVTVTLSSAQIQNLHTTPVELVPAPGAGKAIQVLSIEAFYDFGTLDYAGQPLQIRRSDVASDMMIISSSLFGDSADRRELVTTIVPATNSELLTVNSSIQISSANQGVSGDGIVKLRVTYETITVLV